MAPSLVASLFLLQACALSSMRGAKPEASVRPVAIERLAILPFDIALTGSDPSVLGARRTALGRELQTALAAALGERPVGEPPQKGVEVVRIQHAFATSPPAAYVELAGDSPKPRPRLPEGEVRSVAEATGADALLVARFAANDASRSEEIAQSATAVVGQVALGALTLSPMRLLTAATKLAETSRASELRLALVNGESGEILWASSALVKRAPTAEVVVDLVQQTMAKFPPPAPTYAQVGAR